HDKVDVDTRLRAYNKAMEQMAQRYPDDYEVQVVYALTLQASASKTDLTYANQLQSVAILEKLFEQNPQHPGVSHFIIHASDFAPRAAPPRGDLTGGCGNFSVKAAMETRHLLDRGDWQGAAAMPMNPTGAPMADSLYRFTRGLGMARSGNVAGAKTEIEAMKAVRAA